ncbi:MAG TPA: S53 family peptidase [Thermoplasmata archaeon]|nr:S53 family peptidase [Thermoplasmata archaeon]
MPTLLGIVLLAGIGFPLAAASGPLAGSMIHPWLVRSSVVPTTSPSCSSSGLCPSWVTTAYQFSTLRTNSSTNGTGQTVVIVDACGDASIISDLAQFDSSFGLAKPNLTVYQPQGKPCSDPFGWGIESALDVEWAHAIAPGASIALVEAASPSNTNLFGAWNYSLSHHLGNEISNSWGGGGGCPNVAKRLLSTASSQHVTVLASTGDSSAWGSGTLASAQFPADCSAVVGVGGTSLSVNSTGGYSSESAWNGGGGGYVPSTKEPSYQHKANITDSYAELGKPDVSAVADPATGVWVYEAASGGWFVVGGTSVACPIWAAYFADVNSWRATGALTALGNVVPFLYASVYGVNGGSIHYATTMHDVSSGSNGWAAAAGWDAATGIGSFRAYALASFLASSPTA